MNKLISWLKKLDDNLIKILFIGFIFITPLYPKLPIRMINYTYIAIRLEDLYIVLLGIVFLIQLVRKKITLNKHFFILFILFWAACFLSFLWGAYIQKTVIYHHLGFLHALRRIEYMSVFFVGLSLIKSKRDFFFYLKIIFAVLFIVLVYGIGQKFLGWPAVQTMNPEYAKGYLLILTPEARVSSTFAGHYDLAAYLIFLMPILLGFYFFKKKLIYFLLFIFSIFMLVLTSSRVSYGAYIVSIFGFLLFFRKFKYTAIILIITALFTFSSDNLTSRISRTFQIKQLYVNQQTGQVIVPQKITIKELPAGTSYIQIQGNKQKTQQEIKKEQLLVREKLLDDIRWEASRSGKTLSKLEEEQRLASIFASLKPINTIVSDISFATRLSAEWPRAIKAFLYNPILGLGPSSITEATDNDYLRWLGEFGLLGTLLFLLILYNVFKTVLKYAKKQQNSKKILYFGFIFGLFALLINATYIDVFEASKVAFQFWITSGIFVGSVLIEDNNT